jgi:hypothetical protein
MVKTKRTLFSSFWLLFSNACFVKRKTGNSLFSVGLNELDTLLDVGVQLLDGSLDDLALVLRDLANAQALLNTLLLLTHTKKNKLKYVIFKIEMNFLRKKPTRDTNEFSTFFIFTTKLSDSLIYHEYLT